jgi:pimeloyl-ACP methyl ester carboxylesterase
VASNAARPETRYARSGDVHIAYQVFGEGELDLVLIRGFAHHVEMQWESAAWRRVLDTFGSFARVIAFDRRGNGLSDPVTEPPTLEQRMDDVRAVMDAAGSERAALFGSSEGAPMSILFAAAHPERTQALVLWGGMAPSTPAPDYPLGTPPEALLESGLEFVMPHWGEGAAIELVAPSRADDPEERAFYGRLERASVSPGMLVQLAQMFIDIDVRDVAATVHVPTLVMHRRHDMLVNVRHGRWLAEHMPNARMVEVPGMDHAFEYERFAARPSPTACWRRCCSPTSSSRRRRPPSSATAAGASCSTATTGPCARRSRARAAARSSPPATASSRPSTGPPAASAAPARSSTRPSSRASASAPACTPGSASCAATT